MFYAKSTGGFYDEAIHGENIPKDAVEITNEEHTSLLNAQSSGKIITAGNDGKPVAVDQPAYEAQLPANPPITMFETLLLFSHAVYIIT